MNTQAQAKVRFSSFFRSSMGRELFEDEKREKNGGETRRRMVEMSSTNVPGERGRERI